MEWLNLSFHRLRRPPIRASSSIKRLQNLIVSSGQVTRGGQPVTGSVDNFANLANSPAMRVSSKSHPKIVRVGPVTEINADLALCVLGHTVNLQAGYINLPSLFAREHLVENWWRR